MTRINHTKRHLIAAGISLALAATVGNAQAQTALDGVMKAKLIKIAIPPTSLPTAL
jgi:polar amino acid transport system substrate-binding protein